jgi:hypothetical protein
MDSRRARWSRGSAAASPSETEITMSNTARTLTALVIAALSLPAAAGSWPNLPSKTPAKSTLGSSANVRTAATVTPDGFVGEAGEAGWSLRQYRYFRDEDDRGARASPALVPVRSAPAANVATGKVSGFEYLGGEAGWQPISHTLVLKAGRLAHSDECDHMIRVVKAPTPEELDAIRYSSPG